MLLHINGKLVTIFVRGERIRIIHIKLGDYICQRRANKNHTHKTW
jgi:hypothetical protein